MKGYIPINIPTKRYIKAYIHHKLGSAPLMTKDNIFGQKLFDVLQHKKNEREKEFSSRYNAQIKIYIPLHTFYHRGGILNETNTKSFNLGIELEIKNEFRRLMDFYLELHPNFEANLPAVRKRIGIDLEDWPDDSIRKDYYRYRIKNKMPLLYAKKQPRVVNTKFFFDPAL